LRLARAFLAVKFLAQARNRAVFASRGCAQFLWSMVRQIAQEFFLNSGKPQGAGTGSPAFADKRPLGREGKQRRFFSKGEK
jgi:hypothetical protein